MNYRKKQSLLKNEQFAALETKYEKNLTGYKNCTPMEVPIYKTFRR